MASQFSAIKRVYKALALVSGQQLVKKLFLNHDLWPLPGCFPVSALQDLLESHSWKITVLVLPNNVKHRFESFDASNSRMLAYSNSRYNSMRYSVRTQTEEPNTNQGRMIETKGECIFGDKALQLLRISAVGTTELTA